VAFAQKEESGVRRQVERLFMQAEVFAVHGRKPSGGSQGLSNPPTLGAL
jgi:hypothetical protein